MKFVVLPQLLALALAIKENSNNERPATPVSSMQDSAEDVTPQETYHRRHQFTTPRSPASTTGLRPSGYGHVMPRQRSSPIEKRPQGARPEAAVNRRPGFMISDILGLDNTATQRSPTPPSDPPYGIVHQRFQSPKRKIEEQSESPDPVPQQARPEAAVTRPSPFMISDILRDDNPAIQRRRTPPSDPSYGIVHKRSQIGESKTDLMPDAESRRSRNVGTATTLCRYCSNPVPYEYLYAHSMNCPQKDQKTAEYVSAPISLRKMSSSQTARPSSFGDASLPREPTSPLDRSFRSDANRSSASIPKTDLQKGIRRNRYKISTCRYCKRLIPPGHLGQHYRICHVKCAEKNGENYPPEGSPAGRLCEYCSHFYTEIGMTRHHKVCPLKKVASSDASLPPKPTSLLELSFRNGANRSSGSIPKTDLRSGTKPRQPKFGTCRHCKRLFPRTHLGQHHRKCHVKREEKYGENSPPEGSPESRYNTQCEYCHDFFRESGIGRHHYYCLSKKAAPSVGVDV